MNSCGVPCSPSKVEWARERKRTYEQFCGAWKERLSSFRWKHGKYTDTCFNCEHPAYNHCGSPHSGVRALRLDDPGIVGDDCSKRWLCTKTECTKARKSS